MATTRGKTNRLIAKRAIEVFELMTYPMVQKALMLSPRSVRRLVESGELPVVYVGKHSPRFKPEDVLAFVERGLGVRSSST